MSDEAPALGTAARLARSLVRMLPDRARRAAAKRYFFGQIRAGRFRSAEAEWDRLKDWLEPGDWCVDVGANIGRYALRMSELVGPAGHVVAFEPLTRAFDLLAHFVDKGGYGNVTLLNAAATDRPCLVGLAPNFGEPDAPYVFDTNTGTRISKPGERADENKLGLSVDALDLPHRVKLVKIDVEGHELAVCKGMARLLQRDHPILIIEDAHTEGDLVEFLTRFGYVARRLSKNGRNLVFMRPAA